MRKRHDRANRWPGSTTPTRSPAPSSARRSTRPRPGSSWPPGWSGSCPGWPGWSFRHPVAAVVLACWVPVGHLGWIGPAAMAACAVLVLVTWRCFWPSVRPVGDHPRAEHAAGPVYRRRWPAVMTHRRPGPLVPGPDHLARAGQGHRDPVRRPGSRSGWSPGSAPPTSPTGPTTWPTGSARCCAGSARRGPGRWCWSSSAATPWPPSSPPCPSPDRPDLKALPVGRREDGLPWLVRLHGTHLLIAGATGAGKASLLWGLVRAMLPLMREGLVRVLAADPKLMELAYGRVIFDTYGHYAADPAAIAAMLDQAVADMQARAATFAGYQRDHTPTAEHPFTVVAGR